MGSDAYAEPSRPVGGQVETGQPEPTVGLVPAGATGSSTVPQRGGHRPGIYTVGRTAPIPTIRPRVRIELPGGGTDE